MDNSQDFVSAYFGETAIVCGEDLKPFSFGHWYILYNNRSPFVYPTSDRIIEGDLFFAVAVCKRNFKEAEQFVRDIPACFDWGKYCCSIVVDINISSSISGSNIEPFNFNEQLSTFFDYFKANNKKPYTVNYDDDQEEDNDMDGCPSSLSVLIAMLKSFPQYTEDEIMNMPVSKINYLLAGVSRYNRKIRFRTLEEIEERNRLGQQDYIII